MHDFPLFVTEWTGFEENALGDSDLTDIVQQCTQTIIDQIEALYSRGLFQFQRPLSQSLTVPVNELLPEVQSIRDLFQSGIVSETQSCIVTL